MGNQGSATQKNKIIKRYKQERKRSHTYRTRLCARAAAILAGIATALNLDGHRQVKSSAKTNIIGLKEKEPVVY